MARKRPLGENSAQVTAFEWPWKVAMPRITGVGSASRRAATAAAESCGGSAAASDAGNDEAADEKRVRPIGPFARCPLETWFAPLAPFVSWVEVEEEDEEDEQVAAISSDMPKDGCGGGGCGSIGAPARSEDSSIARVPWTCGSAHEGGTEGVQGVQQGGARCVQAEDGLQIGIGVHRLISWSRGPDPPRNGRNSLHRQAGGQLGVLVQSPLCYCCV